MARRDLTGAVDFAFLETYAGGDADLVEEVLGLFRHQAEMWGPMLDEGSEGWRDAAHTVKGTARGIGAGDLAAACEVAEKDGAGKLALVREELNRALGDIAAYQHEKALQSLRTPRR
jgi:HPt (histidine-containing phosphotransfer) domain-containing protein